jgi:hypothetical protein
MALYIEKHNETTKMKQSKNFLRLINDFSTIDTSIYKNHQYLYTLATNNPK